MRTPAQTLGYCLSQQYTYMRTLVTLAMHANHIHIRTLAVEKQIPHPSAYDIAIQPQPVGFFAHQMKYGILYFRIIDDHGFNTCGCQ
jgi:hypothetical protein